MFSPPDGFCPQKKAFTFVDPMDALLVHNITLSSQDDVDTEISVPRSGRCDFPNTEPQVPVVTGLTTVIECGAMKLEQPAKTAN